MVNQTIFHDETEVYRLAIPTTGVTHPILGIFAAKGCVPAPVTKDGTISTDNTDSSGGCVVRGVGTLFTQASAITNNNSDYQIGRFLVNADGVCRRIKAVNSDTIITLVNPFPASLSSSAPKLVINKPAMITAKSVGTVDAIMQEQDFVVGESFVGGGTPLSYDVSAAGAQIDFSIHE